MSDGLNLIAGEWKSGSTVVENRNPSDLSDVIGSFAQASFQDVDRAVEAAAFAQRRWATTGLETRSNKLIAIGHELMARSEELGMLLSREEGKSLAEGRGEVHRAGQFFTYYGAEVLRQMGETADSVRTGVEVDIRREPVGVVAVISPWNFPMATAAWKIAPALAFGNAVIWKPANLVPASAVALTDIIVRQGLPEGLFSLVMGPGGSVGQKLIEHPGIDAITFTGSTAVGRQIAAAGAGSLARVQCEMGSKNALAIMDGADLDIAVTCAVNGAFGGTGQKCTASSRLVVHPAIHDAFVERLVAEAKAMRVGHALDLQTQMGPVVSEDQLEQNFEYMSLAREEGGEILCGGDRLDRETEGYFMAPVVIAGTKNAWRVNREEMFAPIACIIRADSYDEALATANDTAYGLTSGIVTQSLSRASHFRRHARTGCVMVNLPTAGTDYHVPFGGRGHSSYGPREQGQYAREFYTTVKTAYIRSGEPA